VKNVRMLGLCLVAVFAMSAVVAASASAKKASGPTRIEQEEFKNFAECPTEVEEAYDCVHSITTGGIFQVGKLKVKIVHPITLQGAIPNPLTSGKENIIPAKNGETLSPTPQPVPHGILSVLKPSKSDKAYLAECKNFEASNCGVQGTAEYAGTGEIFLFNFIGEATPGVVLPIKLHLTGSILGEHCYFGSNEDPVTVDFTTGPTSPEPPNEPIHGSTGHLSESPNEDILYDNGYEVVNNEFPAPEAQGCGNGENEAEIDGLIDAKLKLPAPDGSNELRLFGEQAIATAEEVKAHESEV
jgi:hypothetical protein